MIRVQLSDLTAYRVLDPRWSSSPLSGAGAAKHGGRVNRPGIETLYLALDHNTAILEYKQLSTLLRPGTLVSYQVSVAYVIDFREGYIPSSWEPMWQDFYCDWRELWFNQHIEPPSWAIGDAVIASAAKGILFKSRYAGGDTNLVLYPDAFTNLDSMVVYDPDRLLEKKDPLWGSW
ncbi:MAG TPA: RES family NAD+ phosphorylase [Nitrosospira sp.]|nr:RES family NAD+ phosphorylase [Nitrosospira sp.]